MARRLALRSVFGALALVLMGAGAVLLLRALWLAIWPLLGPVGTAAAMGGGLFFVGAVILAVALRPRAVPPPPPAPNPLAAVVAAFAQGYGAGQAIKRR
ncbi:hypothetical protein [Pararhodobacter aggregans]|uniref:Uncharacterized protein n=1 Tax=Pararhodobacter aggregans TaxID=404875 RepID=A0A2T7UWF1_9RHOB|nr:hypothetical protein [Pararhodobacter aggregans]PTW99572.1 hypothetical protein C8N33_11477 [Pararhodobacter aggregans]PVE48899.1 hypothetical protein DDE23_00390 [Pararhodobacter aggregans]